MNIKKIILEEISLTLDSFYLVVSEDENFLYTRNTFGGYSWKQIKELSLKQIINSDFRDYEEASRWVSDMVNNVRHTLTNSPKGLGGQNVKIVTVDAILNKRSEVFPIKESKKGNDLDWIKNYVPFSKEKWIIVNDTPDMDPLMLKVQKILTNLGWTKEEGGNFIPKGRIVTYIKTIDLVNKIFVFGFGKEVIDLEQRFTSLKLYKSSDFLKGNINESDDLDWIRAIPGELPEIDDENKYVALVKQLGIDEVFGDIIDFDDTNTGFEQNSWSHYGIDTFTLDNGQEWAVGTEEEFENGLRDYWVSYADEVGSEMVDESFVFMSNYDRETFAQDMSDNYVTDLSDEDVIIEANLEDEYTELNDKIYELENSDSEVGVSVDDEIVDLEKSKNSLIDRAKDVVNIEKFDEWFECLSDPVYCLVSTHGYYSSVKEMIEYGVVQFDTDAYVDYMVSDSDFGELSRYDGNYYEVDGYYLIRIN